MCIQITTFIDPMNKANDKKLPVGHAYSTMNTSDAFHFHSLELAD
jgi:hypothetical protein